MFSCMCEAMTSLSTEQGARASAAFIHFTSATAEFFFPTMLRTELKCTHLWVRKDRCARAQPSLGDQIHLV